MNVAVDAMGGDKAPQVVVQGAIDVANEPGIHVTLVGNKGIIEEILCSPAPRDHITVHHCEDVVQMGESPLKAIRQKTDASVRVAFDLVKRGNADAVVRLMRDQALAQDATILMITHEQALWERFDRVVELGVNAPAQNGSGE